MTQTKLAAVRKTCCFTGHRDVLRSACSAVQAKLHHAIRQLIEEADVINFIAGGALGFDTLAAEAVLSLKTEYPQIRLLLALPCPEQTKKWTVGDIERYERILVACDKYVYISDSYTPSCMYERNRFMIDHSAFCIAYLENGKKGGTSYTVAYAQKKGLKVINLFE